MCPVVLLILAPEQFHVNVGSGFPPDALQVKTISVPVNILPDGVCCIDGFVSGASEMKRDSVIIICQFMPE